MNNFGTIRNCARPQVSGKFCGLITISFFSKVFLTLDGCGAPSTGCCLASPEANMLEQPAEDAPVQNTLEAGKRGWLGGCNACEHLAHTRPPKCTQSNPHTPRTNQAAAPTLKRAGKAKLRWSKRAGPHAERPAMPLWHGGNTCLLAIR